jgi:hypothetical protein
MAAGQNWGPEMSRKAIFLLAILLFSPASGQENVCTGCMTSNGSFMKCENGGRCLDQCHGCGNCGQGESGCGTLCCPSGGICTNTATQNSCDCPVGQEFCQSACVPKCPIGQKRVLDTCGCIPENKPYPPKTTSFAAKCPVFCALINSANQKSVCCQKGQVCLRSGGYASSVACGTPASTCPKGKTCCQGTEKSGQTVTARCPAGTHCTVDNDGAGAYCEPLPKPKLH